MTLNRREKYRTEFHSVGRNELPQIYSRPRYCIIVKMLI